MDFRSSLVFVASLVSAIVLLELLRLLLTRLWRALRVRHRLRRAIAGERRAERVLERFGWRIVERQPRRPFRFHVDGAPREVELRPDLLAARRGRLFVAEVKTGARAPRIETSATRRQLLEYRVAHPEVDGVLLVDAEKETVREVVFPLPRAGRSVSPGAILFGIGVGLAVGWLIVELGFSSAAAH